MRQATFTQKNPPRERDDLEVSLQEVSLINGRPTHLPPRPLSRDC